MGDSQNKPLPDSKDDLTKSDGFGKTSEESQAVGQIDLSAQVASENQRPKARSKQCDSSQGKREGGRIAALERQTTEFAVALRANFRAWIRESPRAFKKRALSLLGSRLPPYARLSGRSRALHSRR